MEVEVVDCVDRLTEVTAEWDALAVAGNRPRSAPAWVLAWYRHALPSGGHVKVVVVREAGVLVGVAPFYVRRTGFGFHRYDMAAPPLSGVEPLWSPGRQREVSAAFGRGLAGADPLPDVASIDWLPVGSPFHDAVTASWGRALVVEGHTFAAPRIELGGEDFNSWLGLRPRNFRRSLKKSGQEGFEHRMMKTPEQIESRLGDLRRLYELRRAARGGGGFVFDDSFMNLMRDAIAGSAPGRVLLATMERAGQVIAADLVLTAGSEASAWFGGFDDEWAHLGPGRTNLVMIVSDAIDAGVEVIDLGPGVEPYKFSFTDRESTLQSCLLVRRGLRPFHSPAQLLPYRTRQALARAAGRIRRR